MAEEYNNPKKSDRKDESSLFYAMIENTNDTDSDEAELERRLSTFRDDWQV